MGEGQVWGAIFEFIIWSILYLSLLDYMEYFVIIDYPW